LGAQIHSASCEKVEGRERGWCLGCFGAGFRGADDEASLERVEAQSPVGAEDNQYTFILGRGWGVLRSLCVGVVDMSMTAWLTW
jgi:hypothetical protein